MERPILFIKSNHGKLNVNKEAIDYLCTLNRPVTVVGIAGLYRTGKSYFMNRLFEKKKGFELGSTVQSKTKGIWMWCKVHPRDSSRYLILLDTEGLADPESGDANYEASIFTLTILLTNCFIYNSRGLIDGDAIEKLHLVSELTEHIKVNATIKEETGERFVDFFPILLWVLRDFTLDLSIDGNIVTSTEYMNYCLKMKSGHTKAIDNYNRPRKAITKFFPKRKCFTLPFPCDQDKLKCVEELQDHEMNREFDIKMSEIKKIVYESVGISIVDGKQLNGRRLVHLAIQYVAAINSGGIPCIESALESMTKNECENAIKEAIKQYEREFKKHIVFPTSFETLMSAHEHAKKVATEVFSEMALPGKHDKAYLEELKKMIEISFDQQIKKNKDTSTETCNKVLFNLHKPIKYRISKGYFTKPGGYAEYRKEIKQMKEAYHKTPRKGIQENEVICKFMTNVKTEGKLIMNTDSIMTDRERKQTQANAKWRALEHDLKMIREQRARDEQIARSKRERLQLRIERAKRENERMKAYNREQPRAIVNNTNKFEEAKKSCERELDRMLNYLEEIQDMEKSISEKSISRRNLISACVNAKGRLAQLGSTGKYYCCGTLDKECSCCNGFCGPTYGFNACMKLKKTIIIQKACHILLIHLTLLLFLLKCKMCLYNI